MASPLSPIFMLKSRSRKALHNSTVKLAGDLMISDENTAVDQLEILRVERQITIAKRAFETVR